MQKLPSFSTIINWVCSKERQVNPRAREAKNAQLSMVEIILNKDQSPNRGPSNKAN